MARALQGQPGLSESQNKRPIQGDHSVEEGEDDPGMLLCAYRIPREKAPIRSQATVPSMV